MVTSGDASAARGVDADSRPGPPRTMRRRRARDERRRLAEGCSMRAIFISYRRDDTEGYAGRLFDDLCERFGKDSVFMDVAGIEPGRDRG
jgi:hypothetical protein